ncbi:MAG: outer membrane lipoprotein chaperone LolA [Bdellovibrionia bacterium]
MLKRAHAFLILVLGLGALPAFAVSRASTPPLLTQIEKKYARSLTLSAQFTQVNQNAAFGTQKTTRGTLEVKLPAQMRWETVSPDPSLLVSNGKVFWFYTPPFEKGDRGQLIQKPASQVKSKLASALLMGSFSLTHLASLTQKNPTTFVITPKPGTAESVTQATLVIDPAQQLITQVTLLHQGGNQSQITLSQIQLGAPLPDERFVFHTPPGTDLIQD